ncbi:Matrilysin [Tupaia chinensis]|uniref:Matrilysin n=1 Tax=Tupaia chinensis TaxID=246437 RepID=L9KQF0_TUPCH|nr:Matrilysin [Tupaia chinensis]
MWLTFLCAVCLLPGSLALPLPKEAGGMNEEQWKQAQDYLKRFYPYDSKSKDMNSLEVKLKMMQKFFGLPVTGILNSRIIIIMRRPRCGIPDVPENPQGPKWTSSVVTYRIASYTRDLPRFQVDQIVAKAFQMWGKVIPLNFRKVERGIADIILRFAVGVHGDPYPFDGPGNTLAHAFFPGPGLGGDAHFDDDETWTDGRGRGINFLYTATHELGHSLGLPHSSNPKSVMYPTYMNENSEDFQLSWDDIRSIQKLYGNIYYFK